MKWLGLTGGIASGKSTVSALLKGLGIPVVDADQIAREVVLPGTPGLKSIEEVFGPDFINESGLDRQKMGQHVFGQPERLKKLEGILHPIIQAETRRRREELEKSGEPLAIYDIPLLFETKAQAQFDQIILVTSSKEQQLSRLVQQGMPEVDAKKRIGAQIPNSVKEEVANFIIRNNKDLQYLEQEVKRLVEWLEALKA